MASEFTLIDAESLFYQPLQRPKFIVEKLIPSGLTLLSGQQKIGKSWLVLKLCMDVAAGNNFMGLPTIEGDVLYLCLEDTYSRVQDRMFRITDEVSERMKIAVSSEKLSNGLLTQLRNHMKNFPDTKLIVIDVLQRVRETGNECSYAGDYGDLSSLKRFADTNNVAVLAVHHLRKQDDSDVFNKVSGTTGITGSADTTIVLQRDARGSESATLYVVGRDIEYLEYKLKFQDFVWQVVDCKSGEEIRREQIPEVLFRVVEFMKERVEWMGNATKLLEEMCESDVAPNVITKLLNQYHEEVLEQNGIEFRYRRKGDERQIKLIRRDGNDSNDGK